MNEPDMNDSSEMGSSMHEADNGAAGGADAGTSSAASPQSSVEPEAQAVADEDFAAFTVESDIEAIDAKIIELTADLQRIHAEYANYRRRVERDRETFKEAGLSAAMVELFPVLDDISRARAHDDLNGTFKHVAEALEATLRRLGLTVFATEGDLFDPTQHEAIAHETRTDVDQPTCIAVHQQGYSFAGRVLRPALVTVADKE